MKLGDYKTRFVPILEVFFDIDLFNGVMTFVA